MTKRRPSYTKKSAIRFLPFYEELIAQIKLGQPKGMFLSLAQFNGVAISTLQNRFTDALKWLRENNLSEAVDRRAEFEYLRAVIITKAEATGLRVLVLSGPTPQQTLRPDGGSIASATQPADWKEQLEAWLKQPLDPENPVREFTNCLISGDNISWLERITTSLNAIFKINGDKICVVKNC